MPMYEIWDNKNGDILDSILPKSREAKTQRAILPDQMDKSTCLYRFFLEIRDRCNPIINPIGGIFAFRVFPIPPIRRAIPIADLNTPTVIYRALQIFHANCCCHEIVIAAVPIRGEHIREIKNGFALHMHTRNGGITASVCIHNGK